MIDSQKTRLLSLNPIIVIPSRMAARRLPGKPLADIGGQPMIVRVWRHATEAAIGPVVVACAEPAIAEVITDQGGVAILTAPDIASGSDRVRAAIDIHDPERHYTVVINLQGDLPLLPPTHLRDILHPLRQEVVDIATLVCPLQEERERHDPHVVKAAVGFREGEKTARVFYFSRAPIPSGEGPLYHHIGLYAYRRAALETFANLPRGILEQRENLEQLRALENGMRIDAVCVDSPSPGVDTPEDLEKIRGVFSQI